MLLNLIPGHGLVGSARWREIARCAQFWLCVLLAAYWSADRNPPLRVLSQQSAPVAPGTLAQVELRVQRDLTRDCQVSYQRHLLDASGYRFELAAEPSLSAAALAELQRAAPGQLLLRVPIPTRAAPGPARLVASMKYVCNPMHFIWPIPLLLEVPLVIT